MKGVVFLSKKDSKGLFNNIAPIYALFYQRQKKYFMTIFERISKIVDFTAYGSVIDIGCGTGALCSVLNSKGLSVTGIDTASKMLNYAKKQKDNDGIKFILADVLRGLPFEDKTFDVSIASYVAHGLQKSDRKKMYMEMARITKCKVIIHDYNQRRSFVTTIIEWLERGDYFNFIKNAENEMKECIADMKECFSDVIVFDVDVRAAWYICTPK